MSAQHSPGHSMPTPIHTPGPWHYLHPVGSDTFIVQAWDRQFTAGLIRVAYVPNKVYTNQHGWPEHNERHANARLIVAAPGMLSALIDCREALRRAGATGELAVVEAAIAKATGSAS